MRICNIVGIALAGGLGASVQAGMVIFDPGNPNKAIGIANLDIAGVPFNVDFTSELPAGLVYGDFPGVFDFITSESALAATIAVNNALNAEGVFAVGSVASIGSLNYLVGFESESEGGIERVIAWEASTPPMIPDDWSTGLLPEAVSYLEPRTWATFTVVPGPGPVLVWSLVGLGVAFRRRRSPSCH